MAQRTAFYDTHVKHGGKMVDFAGWELPTLYEDTGLIKEHEAVRNSVGMFDVSHMGEIEIKGPDASKFAQYLMTNDLDSIGDYQVIYTFFCYEDGGIQEDLLVYKYNKEHLLLVTNAANIDADKAWLNKQKEGFDVTINDITPEISEVAVQGPNAQKTLQKLTDFDLAEIKFFNFREGVKIAGKDCMVSRTGYTGEDGFEVYFGNDDAVAIWEAIMEAGAEFDIKPAGLGCRDTLRFESNLPLYGNELSAEVTPLEAGFGFFVKLGKEADFIGKEALKKQKEEGLTRKIVGFEMIGKGIPRQGYKVEVDGKEVGVITTGYASPTLGERIGLALVEIEYAELGTELDIAIRKKKVKAKVRDRKFLDRRNKSK